MEDISQNKLSKRKIKGFRTIVPPKSAFTIETSEDFPKLHSLCIASGKRGGGKSVAIANFIKRCKDAGYYDRVWIVTPTYWSNKHIWDIAEIEASNVARGNIRRTVSAFPDRSFSTSSVPSTSFAGPAPVGTVS